MSGQGFRIWNRGCVKFPPSTRGPRREASIKSLPSDPAGLSRGHSQGCSAGSGFSPLRAVMTVVDASTLARFSCQRVTRLNSIPVRMSHVVMSVPPIRMGESAFRSELAAKTRALTPPKRSTISVVPVFEASRRDRRSGQWSASRRIPRPCSIPSITWAERPIPSISRRNPGHRPYRREERPSSFQAFKAPRRDGRPDRWPASRRAPRPFRLRRSHGRTGLSLRAHRRDSDH